MLSKIQTKKRKKKYCDKIMRKTQLEVENNVETKFGH